MAVEVYLEFSLGKNLTSEDDSSLSPSHDGGGRELIPKRLGKEI